MSETIAEFLHSRKGKDVTVILVVILVGILSFGLGRLSTIPPARAPVVLTIPDATHTQVASVGDLLEGKRGVGGDMAVSVQSSTAGARALQETSSEMGKGAYVASKNGTVYHLPWCSGAKRIKEENKRWFASKEEAEGAGLRPASNCKGI